MIMMMPAAAAAAGCRLQFAESVHVKSEKWRDTPFNHHRRRGYRSGGSTSSNEIMSRIPLFHTRITIGPSTALVIRVSSLLVASIFLISYFSSGPITRQSRQILFLLIVIILLLKSVKLLWYSLLAAA